MTDTTNTDITYTYTIVDVDVPHNSMQVLFSSANRNNYTVGVRVPNVGENLEDIVRSAAPIYNWLKDESVSTPPQIGATGALTHSFTGVGLVSDTTPTTLSLSDIQSLVAKMTSNTANSIA